MFVFAVPFHDLYLAQVSLNVTTTNFSQVIHVNLNHKTNHFLKMRKVVGYTLFVLKLAMVFSCDTFR